MQQCKIAPTAVITGDVTLEKDVNIWHYAVLRGDIGPIHIGEGTNIQDHAMVHEKTTVGKYCTVGHRAILHGCTIGDHCVVGMGAILLNDAKIADHCLVAAGAVVTSKMDAPAGSLILGNPAKVVRPLREAEIRGNMDYCKIYMGLRDDRLNG